jgi:nicotinate-nucleotide adenylyltransferase
VLGGTFNPPHLGHVAVAAHAREQLGLDVVVLMPARSSPHKPAEHDPGALHRLRMCELAIAGAAGLGTCAMEVERDAPSYTVDTLEAINASDPQLELSLILGADTAGTLPSWREPDRVAALARLVIAQRSGTTSEQALSAVRDVGGEQAAARARVLEMETLEISSSDVRARVAAGEPVGALVGRGVERYIAEHDLYAAVRDDGV